MKTGIIVYVLGNELHNTDFDEEMAVKNLNIDADRVEVVISGDQHFDVMDAWFKLTTKGMHRIICKFGEAVNNSVIRLTAREFQLCGY